MNPPDSPTDPRPRPQPSPDDSDAWLETALRDTRREHHDDDGFTAKVCAALPPPDLRPSRRALRRRRLLIGATLLGGLVTWWAGWTGLGGSTVIEAESWMAAFDRAATAAPWLREVWPLVFTGACMGVSVWWTFRRMREN